MKKDLPAMGQVSWISWLVLVFCLLGVTQGLEDSDDKRHSDHTDDDVKHTEKNEMIRLPPGKILRQWAVYGFTRYHYNHSTI